MLDHLDVLARERMRARLAEAEAHRLGARPCRRRWRSWRVSLPGGGRREGVRSGACGHAGGHRRDRQPCPASTG